MSYGRTLNTNYCKWV